MTLINKLTKYTELLYNYLSEDAIYARRANKCVTDMALGIITYYDDLLYKYHYNNYSEKTIKSKIINKEKERYSGYTIFPTDISNNTYPYYIKECPLNTENGIPIYIVVYDNFNIKGLGDVRKKSLKGFFNIDSTDKKYVRNIKDFDSKRLVVYISYYIIESFFDNEIEDNKMDLVGTLAHELQHSFDDNIVYRRSKLHTRKGTLLVIDMVNDGCFGYKEGSNIYEFVRSILYLISDEETKARKTEAASIVTYIRRSETIKKEIKEYVIAKHTQNDKAINEMLSPLTQIQMMRTSNLVNGITTSDIFKKYAILSDTIGFYNIFSKCRIGKNKNNFTDTCLLIAGFYMYRNSILKECKSAYPSINETVLKAFFRKENIQLFIDGRKREMVYSEMIDDISNYVFHNVLMIIYRFFNDIFKIVSESVGEIYNINNIEFGRLFEDGVDYLTDNTTSFIKDHEHEFWVLELFDELNE